MPFEVGTFPPSSAVAQALGAQPLEPEESTNYSLGAVFRLSGFEATVDVYRIDIDDRIVLSENLGGTPAIDALLQPFGIGRARFFINGVDTTTEGVDAVVRYVAVTEAAGRWDFTLSANWNSTEVTALPTTNVIPQGGTLFGRINVITFEEGQPDNKQSAMVNWDQEFGFGALGGTVKATHYGKVVEPQPTAALDVFLGGAVLVDLELHTRFGDGVHGRHRRGQPARQVPDEHADHRQHDRCDIVVALLALWIQRALLVRPPWLQLVSSA